VGHKNERCVDQVMIPAPIEEPGKNK